MRKSDSNFRRDNPEFAKRYDNGDRMRTRVVSREQKEFLQNEARKGNATSVVGDAAVIYQKVR